MREQNISVGRPKQTFATTFERQIWVGALEMRDLLTRAGDRSGDVRAPRKSRSCPRALVVHGALTCRDIFGMAGPSRSHSLKPKKILILSPLPLGSQSVSTPSDRSAAEQSRPPIYVACVAGLGRHSSLASQSFPQASLLLHLLV
jgi:hypothetical protein